MSKEGGKFCERKLDGWRVTSEYTGTTGTCSNQIPQSLLAPRFLGDLVYLKDRTEALTTCSNIYILHESDCLLKGKGTTALMQNWCEPHIIMYVQYEAHGLFVKRCLVTAQPAVQD